MFFKQKTAYEMRISDWSSDVCSSDLFYYAAARAAGHPSIPVPPTYFFSLHMSRPAKRGDIFDKENGLGVDMMRILHGEQGFTYHAPAYVGDRLTITTTTEDIYAKKGGALEFVVQTTRFEKDESGRA